MAKIGMITVAERIQLLRAKGHDAQLHPVTRRLALWWRDRWWYVVGGDAARPSLIAAESTADIERETSGRVSGQH